MKKTIHPLALILVLVLLPSCTTFIQMQKTYPPEVYLPYDTNRFVFVNFYDYQLPDFIKDKNESAYAAAVDGYAAGLAEVIRQDQRASFTIADTLMKGYTVLSMQDPGFTDTVRAICSSHGAGLLVALDSLNLWIDWDLYLADNDEGGKMLAKDFYLFSNSYMTLYDSDGVVIDRCAGELSDYVKSKYTIFGMFGGPTLTRAKEKVRSLTAASARDCLSKFYPYTSNYTGKLYGGGPFNRLNKMIVEGNPEGAIEPLRQLSESSDRETARKASANLGIVNEILENRKTSDEVWNSFTAPGR